MVWDRMDKNCNDMSLNLLLSHCLGQPFITLTAFDLSMVSVGVSTIFFQTRFFFHNPRSQTTALSEDSGKVFDLMAQVHTTKSDWDPSSGVDP